VSTTVLNDWQIEEIKKAVKEADRGDFAADKDVQKVMQKWNSKACGKNIGCRPKPFSSR
jgi:predicted transcriptional regulator